MSEESELNMVISLIGLPEEYFKHWLQTFIENNCCFNPEIKGHVLYISSDDLIPFLSCVDISQISEMELYRFKIRTKQMLERLLLNALTPKKQYHFKWCLAALQNFQFKKKENQHKEVEITAFPKNNIKEFKR